MIDPSIRKTAGKLLLAGFEGTVLPEDLRRDCAQGALGGLVLFKRNVETPDQVRELLSDARSLAPDGEAPITCLDQEGGRVIRIREPLTVLPPARAFGEWDDPELTGRAGRLVGLELRALGFTLNFAPVLDVDTNPDSPVIGDRSFGGTVEKVISHGLAFARGMRDAGIIPCAKHFPGHGDANVDSHRGLPIVKHPPERLSTVEMEPFSAWARTGLGPVMTAHIIFEQLDAEHPATASFEILTHILKERLHFNGVILTDDLEMGAIGQLGGAAKLAVQIIRAGAHGLLVCRDAALRNDVLEALCREATVHPDFLQKMENAAFRLSSMAYPSGPTVAPDWVGSNVHRDLQQELYRDIEQHREQQKVDIGSTR